MNGVIQGGLFLLAALAGYAAVMWLAAQYGKDWQPPEGMETSDWALRHKVGVGLGALAVIVCVLLSLFLINGQLARILFVAQAVILAAAGASDIRRFHLPLPLTLGGIVVAIATAVTLDIPFVYIGFGLMWAVIISLFYALLTKRKMALGDYIAAIWIGLAMPFNGMFAILAGDICNTALVKLGGQKGRKVAAAGPWLLFAAALIAVPPFFVLMNRQSAAVAHVDKVFIAAKPISPLISPLAQPVKPEEAALQAARKQLFWTLAEYAGEETASVATVNTREARMARSKQAAKRVAEYQTIAVRYQAGASLVQTLQDLGNSLDNYDIEGVRSASERLAAERETLHDALSVNTTNTALSTQN